MLLLVDQYLKNPGCILFKLGNRFMGLDVASQTGYICKISSHSTLLHPGSHDVFVTNRCHQ